MEEDKASDPPDVRYLCAETQVPQTDGVSYLIEQLRFWLHVPSHVHMPLAMLHQRHTGIATQQNVPSDMLLHAVMCF